MYLAEETELKRLVAMKVLYPHVVATEELKKRFRHEAETTAKLEHPAIVPVYRMCEGSRLSYLVMKFVDGTTFGDDEASKAPATERFTRIVKIVKSVAEALHYSHMKNVVHRDIKPSNILIDRDGNAHLTDFGIAKVAEQTVLTTLGQNPGTPAYMSPELAIDQLSRHTPDAQCDVFSLGVVLYEALAGERPFRGNTAAHVLKAVCEHYPPNLSRLNRSIPRDLATITAIAIEKNRSLRYPTAAHLATDLDRWLRGEPPFGKPIGLLYRLRRWARLHRAKAAMVAVALLLMLSLTLFGIVVHQRRAAMSSVQVTTSAPTTTTLWIAHVDPVTLTLRPAERLGTLPLDFRRDPGQYRLTALSDDGAFAEAAVVLLGNGEHVDLLMNPTPASQTAPIDMIRLEGGTFDFGKAERRGIQSLRSVTVAPFLIDRTEVSNAEYDRFVRATSHPLPRHWIDHPGPAGAHFDPALAERPVVGISWEDAAAFARWNGKRLPTVFEWEFAARQPGWQTLPWNDAIVQLPDVPCEDMQRAGLADNNFQYLSYAKYTRDVGSDPALATPLGLMHIATNVQEMTESVVVGTTTVRVIKGAGWPQLPQVVLLTETMTLPYGYTLPDGTRAGDTSMKVGFRCARSLRP